MDNQATESQLRDMSPIKSQDGYVGLGYFYRAGSKSRPTMLFQVKGDPINPPVGLNKLQERAWALVHILKSPLRLTNWGKTVLSDESQPWHPTVAGFIKRFKVDTESKAVINKTESGKSLFQQALEAVEAGQKPAVPVKDKDAAAELEKILKS